MSAPDPLLRPALSLLGSVDDAMCRELIDGLQDPDGTGDLVIRVTTHGGDPDMARRMVLEVDHARRRLGRRLVFLGQMIVYSAGATFMAGFPPQDRYLTADTRLMIHCRQLDSDLKISGPIRASLPFVEAMLRQLQDGVKLEVENFERLIAGTDVTIDELVREALHNWYLTADEAHRRGLVAGIV